MRPIAISSLFRLAGIADDIGDMPGRAVRTLTLSRQQIKPSTIQMKLLWVE